MTDTVNVIELTDKDFKTLIKSIRSFLKEEHNPDIPNDKEFKLQKIPTYNKVLKGTETVLEAVELIYDLLIIETIYQKDLNVKTVMSSARYYLLERHALVLEEMGLTSDQFKELQGSGYDILR